MQGTVSQKGRTAWVFDVQRFSVHDGPGIRTTVFLQGCPLRCAWCQNPESFTVGRRLMLYREACMACEACAGVCPLEGAGPLVNGDGRAEGCTVCGACAEICPMAARKTAGQKMNGDAVFDLVMRDRPFYGQDGGVTFCGGEPLLQWGFLAPLADRFRERGIHVTVDTCGAVSRQVVEAVPGRVDLVLADLKLVSPKKHLRWTGKDNTDILDAVRYWARAMPGRLWISVPIIPGVHDGEEIERMGRFLARLDHTPAVRLLPYERFGESKYDALGTSRTVFTGAVEPLVAQAREAFFGLGVYVMPT